MRDKRKLFTYCPQEVFLSLKGVSQSDFSGSLFETASSFIGWNN
jgi:hypothetical protein